MTTQQEQQQQQLKRPAVEAAESLIENVRAIVFDDEGTMIPPYYLKDIMNAETLEYHLKFTSEEPDTIKAITALRELSKKEKEDGVEGAEEIPAADDAEGVIKKVVANVQRWIDSNSQSAEFKLFRDHVLKQLAHEDTQKLKTELYDDVLPTLRMLSEEGFNLYSYTEESAEYVRRLLDNTQHGSVTDCFASDFDEATMGPKKDKESYKKIAAEIGIDPDLILYISDSPEEAEAASKAGWKCALVIRPGNAGLTEQHLRNFACIEQLDELYGDEDDDDIKRLHGDDNGEAEDDEEDDEIEDEVDEDEEGEEDDEGEGEDA